MPVPRWFELTLFEAQDANKSADYSHLGEQFGLQVEEAVPRKSIGAWWELAKEWKDGSHVERGEIGDMERRVLSFLEENCPECMKEIPEDKTAEFLKGLFAKKGE